MFLFIPDDLLQIMDDIARFSPFIFVKAPEERPVAKMIQARHALQSNRVKPILIKKAKPMTTQPNPLTLHHGAPQNQEKFSVNDFYLKVGPRLNAVLKASPPKVKFTAVDLVQACGYNYKAASNGVLTRTVMQAIGNAPNIRESYDENGRVQFHLDRKLGAKFDFRKTILEMHKAIIKHVQDELF